MHGHMDMLLAMQSSRGIITALNRDVQNMKSEIWSRAPQRSRAEEVKG